MKKLSKIIAIALVLLTVAVAFTACNGLAAQEKKLIGSWQDTSGVTGYAFNEDGTVVITFANFDLLGQNITGKGNGTYTTSEDAEGNYHVAITYTLDLALFSKTLTDEFIFNVDKNTLSLRSLDGKRNLVLVNSASEALQTTAPTSSAAPSQAA